MAHENLKILNDWCEGTKMLYLWVNFQGRSNNWAVRVLTRAMGKAHPIRTLTGDDLEVLCADMLVKAKQKFEDEKASIERKFKEWEKQQRYSYHRETREIEAMHHSASDF